MLLFSDRVWLEGAIQAARITLDGPLISEVIPCDRARIGDAIDLGDKLVTPAFVNAHTHLAMAAYRGIGGARALANNVVEDLFYRLEAEVEVEDIRAFTRMGAYECLLNGTGAVWDHYYGGRVVAEALAEVGLTGVVAPTLQDLGGPGKTQHQAQLEATLDIATDAGLHAAGVVAALGPHATDTVSPALWDKVAEVAQAHHLPIHVHVAQSIDEVRRSYERSGLSPIAGLLEGGWLQSTPTALLVHAVFANQAELDRLDPGRHVLGFCPWSQALFAFPAALEPWRRRGFRWAVGTDAGACNDGMNVQQELRLVPAGNAYGTTHSGEVAQLLREGSLAAAENVSERRRLGFDPELFLPETLLEAAWFDGHPTLKVGRIAQGYRANLAVWDLDHPALWPAGDPLRALVYGDAAQALSTLIVNGRVVGEIGAVRSHLLRSDTYRAHREEASMRLHGLLSRVGLTSTASP